MNLVWWLLTKGIPWSVSDMGKCIPEDIASKYGNDKSQKCLREWAVQKGELVLVSSKVVEIAMFILNAEYKLLYKLEFGESHLDKGKPFSIQCVDWIHHNAN